MQSIATLLLTVFFAWFIHTKLFGFDFVVNTIYATGLMGISLCLALGVVLFGFLFRVKYW